MHIHVYTHKHTHTCMHTHYTKMMPHAYIVIRKYGCSNNNLQIKMINIFCYQIISGAQS